MAHAVSSASETSSGGVSVETKKKMARKTNQARAALDPRRSATSRKNRVASVSVQQYARWNVGIVICVPLAFAIANNSPYVMWRTSKRESRSDKPGHSFRNARGGKGAFDAFEAVAARVAVVDRFG